MEKVVGPNVGERKRERGMETERERQISGLNGGGLEKWKEVIMEGKRNVFCMISTIFITLCHFAEQNSQQLHSRDAGKIFLAAFFTTDRPPVNQTSDAFDVTAPAARWSSLFPPRRCSCSLRAGGRRARVGIHSFVDLEEEEEGEEQCATLLLPPASHRPRGLQHHVRREKSRFSSEMVSFAFIIYFFF